MRYVALDGQGCNSSNNPNIKGSYDPTHNMLNSSTITYTLAYAINENIILEI